MNNLKVWIGYRQENSEPEIVEQLNMTPSLAKSAPELLEQLKYVRTVLVNWIPEKARELVSECDSIIAKAEGSEK